ncbi:MAG: hypothetical protein ACHREM_10650 [Polyangiales bacterium]
MTDPAKPPPRPPLDWSGNAPMPFTRESSIRLDDHGHFFHDGERVEHPGLERAMHRWLRRHPTNGRWVLENGWDWCYVTVDVAAFFVRSARVEGDHIEGLLSDGDDVEIAPSTLRMDRDGALWCDVHGDREGGPFPARFDAYATAALGDAIEERDGALVITVGGTRMTIADRS